MQGAFDVQGRDEALSASAVGGVYYWAGDYARWTVGNGVRGGFRGGVEGVLRGLLLRFLLGIYGSPGSSGQLGCHRHMKL